MEAEKRKVTDLTNVIELLRKKLVKLVSKHGFSAREVVELSQHLDRHIVELQRLLYTCNRGTNQIDSNRASFGSVDHHGKISGS